MPEYIEREALRDELLNISIDISNLYNCGILEGLDRATKRLNEQPAADVAPVRHGRWEDKPNPQWRAYDIRYCSACGWSIHKSKLRKADLNWAYCPNCGAIMDGGQNNEC